MNSFSQKYPRFLGTMESKSNIYDNTIYTIYISSEYGVKFENTNILTVADRCLSYAQPTYLLICCFKNMLTMRKLLYCTDLVRDVR